MMSDKPSLLITGGSGYIGSALVREALASGYRINVLDNASLPADPQLHAALGCGDIQMFQGSITQYDVVQKSLRDVVGVVHLAGISDGRAGKANPELTRRINAETMETLLEEVAKAGVARFVFASTMGVYGNSYTDPLTEDLPMRPVDPYSESKAIAEKFVADADSASLQTVSLRIAMVYGADVRIREDFLVNNMCLQAVKTKRLQVLGGAQQRPQIHIRDLTSVILSMFSSRGRAICRTAVNVVESNPSLLRIAETICDVLPDTYMEVTPSQAVTDTFVMSGARLSDLTGFVPKYQLRDGIAQTIRYFQNNYPSVNEVD
jgi:nucleoside-diphosphate-sugar epimerase